MTELEHLTNRVTDIEQQCLYLTKKLTESEKRLAKASLTEHSFRLAVRSLGSEIAEKNGISYETYLERFQALCRWHLDELLRSSSDQFPDFISEIDARTLDQIPTDDSPPRVLDSDAKDAP